MTSKEIRDLSPAEITTKLREKREQLLNLRGIYYVRSRMDRATTTRKGVPDFIIILPGERAWLVEVKTEVGTLSQDQRDEGDRYRRQARGEISVVRSSNIAE